MNINITLRDPIASDANVFYEHQADPVACRVAHFDARTEKEFTQHWQTITSRDDVKISTIDSDGSVVGNLVSWQQDGQRLVGFWLGQNYWGKGVASRALELFTQSLPRPLFAYVHTSNIASQRVLEKCGFMLCTHVACDNEQEFLFRLD
ncbi:GNAT family N-acetyltransferase [Parashewanella tropica]|uniref:GNAT family N-acetyltransferase n=1 Tax=Parashewanella tropica TaxID=2547970 RepID=UPI00105934E6|nr:GNAT family N-acetyltransferase [Parashewanella tropica]